MVGNSTRSKVKGLRRKNLTFFTSWIKLKIMHIVQQVNMYLQYVMFCNYLITKLFEGLKIFFLKTKNTFSRFAERFSYRKSATYPNILGINFIFSKRFDLRPDKIMVVSYDQKRGVFRCFGITPRRQFPIDLRL